MTPRRKILHLFGNELPVRLIGRFGAFLCRLQRKKYMQIRTKDGIIFVEKPKAQRRAEARARKKKAK